MHLTLSWPDKRFKPMIAKMAKKKSKMMIVSLSNGMAWNKADIKTFSPLTEEIVLSGLMTLKALSPLKLKDPSVDALGSANNAG